MNYQALQEAIATAIKTNGEGEITGAILQSVLQSIVSIVGANYQYMGVATTSTNPGTPAGSVFYLTSTAGTYTNFNNIVVEDGKLTALMWDSTAWSKSEIADLGGGGGNVDYDVISGSNVQLKDENATPIYPKTNIDMVDDNGVSLALSLSQPLEVGYKNVSISNSGVESASTSYMTSDLLYPDVNGQIKIDVGGDLVIKALYKYNMDGSFNEKIATGLSVTTYTYTGTLPIRVTINGYNPMTIPLYASLVTYTGLYKGLKAEFDSLKKSDYNTDMAINSSAGLLYELGSLNNNGEETTSSTNIRTELLYPDENGQIVFSQLSPELWQLKQINAYNADGTHIARLFTSATYTSYTYKGANPIRMVFGVNTGISFLYKNITSVKLSGYVPKNLQGVVVDLNPLKGKKFIVNGDSIPQGAGTNVTHPYPFKVAEKLNMNALMYPIGGSTIAYASNFGGAYASLADFNADSSKDTSKLYDVQTGMQSYDTYKYSGGSWAKTTAGADNTRTPITSRYSFMENGGDVIFVAGGTNDFQYSWSAFGEMADRTPYTFYGALHTLCLGLLTKYPTATIVFCTPIKRSQGTYTTPDSTNTLGKTLKDYAEAIKEVCEYYSIPVIDLYSKSGLNPHVASQTSLFDELLTHPTQDGHDMIARVVTAQLKTIVGL